MMKKEDWKREVKMKEKDETNEKRWLNKTSYEVKVWNQGSETVIQIWNWCNISFFSPMSVRVAVQVKELNKEKREWLNIEQAPEQEEGIREQGNKGIGEQTQFLTAHERGCVE